MDEDGHRSKRPRTQSSTGLTQQPREVGVMRRDGTRQDATFIGSGSGIHFVKSVKASLGKTARARADDDELVPGEEDALPNSPDQGAADRWWTSSEVSTEGGVVLSFEQLVEWSQTYFTYWHCALPFLHAPSFLTWCENLAQRPLADVQNTLSTDRMTIIRAVMSISLADRRQKKDEAQSSLVPATLVFQSYQHAILSTQRLITASPSIESLQAALAVQIFLVSMLRHNAASRLGGSIVRTVFQMGLHRCPVRFPTFSNTECDMRQRIFWSIYCVDRYICQSLGTPISLRDDDIDVCSPNDEHHSSDNAKQSSKDDRFALLALLCSHAEIKGLTLELHNKSIGHRHTDIQATEQIDLKLAKWANRVEHTIELLSDETTLMSRFHQATLSVLHQESIIALNRPLLAASKEDADYSSALQSCISASRSTIKTLISLIQLTDFDSNGVLPLVWPSFTWATWMSAFIVIYAANEGEMPLPVAVSLATKGFEILKHLGRRGSVWPGACAAVVQDLIHRLKSGLTGDGPNLQTGAAFAGAFGAQAGSGPAHESSAEGQIGDSTAPVNLSVHNNPIPGRLLTALDPADASLDSLFDFEMLQAGGFDTSVVSNGEDIDLFKGFEIPFWIDESSISL